jgi:hypothetical protein
MAKSKGHQASVSNLANPATSSVDTKKKKAKKGNGMPLSSSAASNSLNTTRKWWSLLDDHPDRLTQPLHVQTLFPGRVFAAKDFFTPAECQAWINMVEQQGFKAVFHKETRHIAHRDSDKWIEKNPEIADRL